MIRSSQGNSPRKMDSSASIALVYDAIKNRNLPSARAQLKAILDADPANETAWHLFAHVAETKQEAIEYLKKTLMLNPANERAKNELVHLQIPQSAPESRTYSIPSEGTVDSSSSQFSAPPSIQGTRSKPGARTSGNNLMFWLIAGVVGLLLVCGAGGLYLIGTQYFSRPLAAGPLPPVSTPIASQIPLPQVSSIPTQDTNCNCTEATIYLEHAAGRYQELSSDIDLIQQALQNGTTRQLDFSSLNSKAQTYYHDQVGDVPPPCLLAFQSRIVALFWNWQQSLQYVESEQYTAAEVFFQGFTDQMTALAGEGKKVRQLLQSCPGNNQGQNPTF
jgi:hypothetical protein